MICARLEDELHLPVSWAYTDIENGVFDGFQVWESPVRAAYASTGVDCDGCYGIADGYRYLIVVDANEVEDSAGEWYAVSPSDIRQSFFVEIQSLLNWVNEQNDDPDSDLNDFDWIEENESVVDEWIKANMKEFTPTFINTLT